MKRYIILGVGPDGTECLGKLQRKNKDSVAFFCDNNPQNCGLKLNGIQILSFSDFLKIYKNYHIIVTTPKNNDLVARLEANGIHDYILYMSDREKNACIPHDRDEKKHEIDQLIEEVLTLDKDRNPLEDFPSFRDRVIEVKGILDGRPIYSMLFSSETRSYGYGKALMDYAGLEDPDYNIFPLVFHGSFFGGHRVYPTAMIADNEFDKEVINQKYPYIPIFALGSYIKYATPIYDESELLQRKKKLGKNLLIFATHDIEVSKVLMDERQILKKILEEYAPNYDTVTACVYWFDADKEFYEILRREGVNVVSCGFRFDEQFVKRQKTLFALYDDVLTIGFSTAAIFSLVEGKKLIFDNIQYKMEYYSEAERRVNQNQTIKTWSQDIKDLLSKGWGPRPVRLTKKEMALIDKCTGLTLQWTPEEIRLMYEVCKDILEAANYTISSYPIAVYQTYHAYQHHDQFDKLAILSRGLGKGFWLL